MKEECSFQAAPGGAPLPFSHGSFHPGGERALNKIAKLLAKLRSQSGTTCIRCWAGTEGNAELLPVVCIPRKRDGGHESKKAQRRRRSLKTQPGLVGILSNYFGNGFRIWQLFAVCQTVRRSVQNPPLRNSKRRQPRRPGSWTFHPGSPAGTPAPRAGAGGRARWLFRNHLSFLAALKKMNWGKMRCHESSRAVG